MGKSANARLLLGRSRALTALMAAILASAIKALEGSVMDDA
jgi:hypothetical protein